MPIFVLTNTAVWPHASLFPELKSQFNWTCERRLMLQKEDASLFVYRVNPPPERRRFF